MKVSVLMLTYNHEEYILKAIEGILLQEVDFDVELIIGNDSSSDISDLIINDYLKACKTHISVNYYYHERNIGMHNNYIFIHGKATGKYIAHCEGDDYWTDPLKLQKQVDFMEANPDYSICFHNVSIYDEINRLMVTDNITRKVNETTGITDLALGNYLHTPSVLLLNDFKIPDWFKDVTIGDWSLYMLQCGNRKIKKLEDIMAVYRISSTNYWSSKSKEYRINSTLETIITVLENADLPRSAKNILKDRITTKKQKRSLIKRVWRKLKK